MNILKLATILLVVTVGAAWAQPRNILISNTQVAGEPAITINPKNPAQIFAASNLTACFWSSDTGKTWTQNNVIESTPINGDPNLQFDTAGRVLWWHLSGVRNTPAYLKAMRMNYNTFPPTAPWPTSVEIGKRLPKHQDKEGSAIDRRNNHLYLAWTQFDSIKSPSRMDSSRIVFTKSTDGGATWDTTKVISRVNGNCLDDGNTVEGSVPAVGPNGEVYVSWAGPLGIAFTKSTDGGATFPPERPLATLRQPAGWRIKIPFMFRANSQPVTVADVSQTPTRGNVYVVWADQTIDTTDTDILLLRSTDGGSTFSQPIRVNNDAPGKQQFFPWVTVDQATGYVWLIFYDRRNYSDNKTDVWAAVSTAGARTFSNFRLNRDPIFTQATAFLGDYIGIAAHANVVRPIWAANETGRNRTGIFTAIIKADSVLVGNKERIANGTGTVLAYYSTAEGKLSVFAQGQQLEPKLDVLSLEGKRIAKLRESNRTGGTKLRKDYGLTGLAKGVYLLRYQAGSTTQTTRFVVE